MGIIVFSDKDIILKLSQYDLLHEACNVLNVEPDKVMVLHSSKHHFAKMCDKARNGTLQASYSIAGLERAIEFVESAHAVEEYSNLDWFQAMDNIDFGEAQLATWVADDDGGSILLTGDKRFLKALPMHVPARLVYDRLRGRVVCFETLVKGIIQCFGCEPVRSAVKNNPNCDQTLRIAFGSHCDLPEPQVIAGLESYIGDVVSYVGEGWLRLL